MEYYAHPEFGHSEPLRNVASGIPFNAHEAVCVCEQHLDCDQEDISERDLGS